MTKLLSKLKLNKKTHNMYITKYHRIMKMY